jgi:chemotaxis family two-component system response regulator Rcp1
MNGHEFLSCMKADADLGTIPVIVVTPSEAEADVVKSYQLHASCLIRKPGQLSEFDMLVKSLSVFWLNSVIYPRQMTAGKGWSISRDGAGTI